MTAFRNGRIWRRKQKRSEVYVGDWTDADGKRHRKALSSDRRVAERMFADIIRKRDLCASGLGVEEGFDLPFADVRDEFLAEVRSQRSKGYGDRVECLLRQVALGMKIRTIRDLQPQPFLVYRRARLEQGVTNRTANMDLTVVRTLLNWAVRMGYIAFSPLAGIKMLPTGKGYERTPRRAMTEDEIERFIAASMRLDQESMEHALAARTITNGTKGRRYETATRKQTVSQTPLWLTLLETGARFGEAAQATWGDLSEERGTLTLRAKTTKTRKERILPLRAGLVDVLRDLRVIHHEVRGRIPAAGDLIFLTPKGVPWNDNRRNALHRLTKTLKAAGIDRVDERGEKIDIHSLRHTAASRWARNGVGLAQAQKLLGHSDPKLTAAIYTHLDAEDLRSAVESLPPMNMKKAVGAEGTQR